MKNWIDQVTHEPLRHWHRFIKGFSIFIAGVAIWYLDQGLLYIGLSDSVAYSYSIPSKVISLVFLAFGATFALVGYSQILICRLLPSKGPSRGPGQGPGNDSGETPSNSSS